MLFGHFDIHGSELAAFVTFTDDAENVTNNTLLPVNKLERLTIPFPLGMAEVVDKKDRCVRKALFVNGAWGLEAGRLVTTEFA